MNIKILKTLLILAIVPQGTVHAQYFEGIVTYEIKSHAKSNAFTDQYLAKVMGTRQEYYINHSYYMAITDNADYQTQIFNGNNNRLYFISSEKDSALWIPAVVMAEKISKSNSSKSAKKILGKECDELVLTLTEGKLRFYYNSDYQMDPNLFANHKYFALDTYTQQAGAIPLMIVLENDDYSISYTAIEIKEEEVPDSKFKLPDNKTYIEAKY